MIQIDLRRRADLFQQIRLFFQQRSVLEVSTPVLGRAAGTDPSLEPFVTTYQGPGYAKGLPLYLQTSPEFHMKRLLSEGSGCIFQICPAFRNGEHGNRHNPEFTILEWYRLNFDHHQLMDEVAALIQPCFEKKLGVLKISYQQLFKQFFSIDPLATSIQELTACAQSAGISGADELVLDSIDTWLDLLMSHVIEPKLGRGTLCFIYDYPAPQAALARLKADDPRVASRFELYYEGVELANGFHELSNADEQLARFEQDNQHRRQAGQQTLPIDQAFIQALKSPGLPDCSGVALGLDRLLMLMADADSLAAVTAFTLGHL